MSLICPDMQVPVVRKDLIFRHQEVFFCKTSQISLLGQDLRNLAYRLD